MDDRRALGQRGEDLAVEHLRRAGYAILDRNVRTRYGEIDVVAQDGTYTVFVEVRTFRSKLMAPVESITPRKQQRIIALGQWYLAQHGKANADWRADVIAISVPTDGQPPLLEHLIGAIEES